jgi:hypothetical protein
MIFGIVYMPGIDRRLFALTMCTTPYARGFAIGGCFTRTPLAECLAGFFSYGGPFLTEGGDAPPGYAF